MQLRGLSGSLDMVLLAAYFEKQGGVHLLIATDKEEAAYLNSDLQNLLGSEEHRIFPGSFKRPYHYDEVDNANVLLRAEMLNQLLEKLLFGFHGLRLKAGYLGSVAANHHVLDAGIVAFVEHTVEGRVGLDLIQGGINFFKTTHQKA
jgi:hypothetical protein